MSLLRTLQAQAPQLMMSQPNGVGQTFNDYTNIPEPQSNYYGQGTGQPQPFGMSTYALQPQQHYNQQQPQIGVTAHNLAYLSGAIQPPDIFAPLAATMSPAQSRAQLGLDRPIDWSQKLGPIVPKQVQPQHQSLLGTLTNLAHKIF